MANKKPDTNEGNIGEASKTGQSGKTDISRQTNAVAGNESSNRSTTDGSSIDHFTSGQSSTGQRSGSGQFGSGQSIGGQESSSVQSGSERSTTGLATATNTGGGAGAGTAAARSLYDQAKETAGQAYEIAAEKATTKLEEQKTTLSGGLSTIAESVRKVGENLRGPDVQEGIGKYTAEYSGKAAEKIESVAEYFEQKGVRDMYSDLENFARRNPLAFIGGAFALGLLTARFLKSGSPDQRAAAAGATFTSDSAANEYRR